MKRTLLLYCFLPVCCVSMQFSLTFAQVASFPYVERFDAASPPALPAGWETSTGRVAAGDFFTTGTSPRSSPNAVQSTNSTVAQFLISPLFNFSDKIPAQLEFWTSRSSTHTSAVLVEASIDNGFSYTTILGDTLKNNGTTSYSRTVLPLPGSLAHQSAVRFRWRVLGGSGGTAGTFRLDDVSISVLIGSDLGITGLRANPLFPTSESQISLQAVVHNNGVLPIDTYRCEFYRDMNSNQLAEPFEIFSTAIGSSLQEGDSAFVSVLHPPLHPGSYRFVSVVVLANDENTSNDSLALTLTVGVPPGEIVINEIQYAPLGDEPEWVELYNTSEDSINLKSWRISDNNTGSKALLAGSDFVVRPHGYAIIARDTLFSLYHPDVSAPLAFASFSALNNTSEDAVVLFDNRLLTLDSVRYAPFWGGGNGVSLERIDPFSRINSASNWTVCIDSLRSTPGRENSAARKDSDLALSSIAVSGLSIVCSIRNPGRTPVAGFSIHFFDDHDRDGVGADSEFIDSVQWTNTLEPLESTLVSFEWISMPSGEHTVIVVVQYPNDERKKNNFGSVVLQKKFERGSLVINEIMYEPSSGQAEWVELFNPGLSSVDVDDWVLSDSPTASGAVNKTVLSSAPLSLPPGGFLVVASDSTFFNQYFVPSSSRVLIAGKASGLGLGNDGDDVVMKDQTGTTIDSVHYSSTWHNPLFGSSQGRSLERVNAIFPSNDSSNWSSSANPNGGSPGSENSIFTPNVAPRANLSFAPNPFSPDGDGYQDFCIISYQLPSPSALVRIQIFDLAGRLVRTLTTNTPTGDHGEVIWDGTDDHRRVARLGPYVLLLEAVDGAGRSIAHLKSVLVVAIKL